MMWLTGRFADLWNPSEYVSAPAALPAHRDKLFEACAEAGRPASAVALTAHVPVAFPDLGATPVPPNIPAYLSGSTEEIAAAMYDMERMGAAHLMVYCAPYTMAALDRLAGAVAAYRQRSPQA
jgi:hypothetical protein